MFVLLISLLSICKGQLSPLEIQRWVDTGVYYSGRFEQFNGVNYDNEWFLHGDRSTSVLIFGDSLNRNMIDDLCKSFKPRLKASPFGSEYFLYIVGRPASKMCHSPFGKMGFVHAFGAAAKGPYFKGMNSTNETDFIDTERKIKKGVELWVEKYGAPDMVLFRTEMWDAHLHAFESDQDIKKSLELFIEDTQSRIQQLKSLLPESTLLATHTSPFPNPVLKPQVHKRFSAFSDALRFIALKNNLVLFDWQNWILKTMISPTEYLKDGHHPRYVYSSSLAKVILSTARHWKSEISLDGKNSS